MLQIRNDELQIQIFFPKIYIPTENTWQYLWKYGSKFSRTNETMKQHLLRSPTKSKLNVSDFTYLINSQTRVKLVCLCYRPSFPQISISQFIIGHRDMNTFDKISTYLSYVFVNFLHNRNILCARFRSHYQTKI